MKFVEHSSELYSSGILPQCRSLARKMALDFLSLQMIGCRKMGGSPKSHLRILHYHHVFEDERRGFEEQLSYLKDYFVIKPLGEAARELREGRLKEPTLSITFDDGFKNNVTIAAEILDKQSVKACFYIVTDFISLQPNSFPQVLDFCKNRLCIDAAVENMTWDDIRLLMSQGHEIGSHSVTHPSLPLCSVTEQRREISESKTTIEREIREPIKHFSLPFGLKSHVSEQIGLLAKQAGYETCAYAVRGPNLSKCDPYQLTRDDVSATWSTREIMTHFFRTMGRTKLR